MNKQILQHSSTYFPIVCVHLERPSRGADNAQTSEDVEVFATTEIDDWIVYGNACQ